MMKKIMLLAGPTAGGKSATALKWAAEVEGEIVNSDSMQIYAELRDITARPSEAEEAQCRHHLYGTLKGDDPCSAERWREMAMEVIEDIWARGKRPIVVGGTGLYFRALTEGLSPVPEIDADIRRKVRAMSGGDCPAELLARDPEMAAKLAPADAQRNARALEVLLSTGKSLLYWQAIPPSGGLQDRHDVEIDASVLLLDRAVLYERCDRRFRNMVEEGKALEEVRALKALNYPGHLPVMKSLGVPSLMKYLADECSLEEAIVQSQTQTRQFAKRQMTWFKNQCGGWKKLN